MKLIDLLNDVCIQGNLIEIKAYDGNNLIDLYSFEYSTNTQEIDECWLYMDVKFIYPKANKPNTLVIEIEYIEMKDDDITLDYFNNYSIDGELKLPNGVTICHEGNDGWGYDFFHIYGNDVDYHICQEVDHSDDIIYSQLHEFIDIKLFDEKEIKLIKFLYDFLFKSENGTNTMCDFEYLDDEGYSREYVESFVKKFWEILPFTLEIDECNDGVEIYYKFIEAFNLNELNAN